MMTAAIRIERAAREMASVAPRAFTRERGSVSTRLSNRNAGGGTAARGRASPAAGFSTFAAGGGGTSVACAMSSLLAAVYTIGVPRTIAAQTPESRSVVERHASATPAGIAEAQGARAFLAVIGRQTRCTYRCFRC